MQRLKWGLIFGVFILSGCQKDDSHSSVLGAWNCQEYTEINGNRTYSVNIERNHNMPNATNEFAIRNFYRLGDGDENLVYFRQVNDTLLVMPVQTTSVGVSVNGGTGIVRGGYNHIEWQYTVTATFGQDKCQANYY